MTDEERDIQRKLRVLQHAEKVGNARKACRYFGIGRSSFYRWRDAYQKLGEASLKNAKSIPKNPANQTPTEIVEKVLYLRRVSPRADQDRLVFGALPRHQNLGCRGLPSSAMASTACPEAHECVNCTPSAIKNRCQDITSKWTSSF